MCGIFGVIAGPDSPASPGLVEGTLRHLFRYSESRGKESAGLATLTARSIRVLKQPIAASRFIRTSTYRQIVNDVVRNGNGQHRLSHPIAVMGHSRLVTNGAQENNQNNQPVIAGGMVGIHNGIIVNDAELWRQYPQMQRAYDVDTEVLLCLIRHHRDQGRSLIEATQAAFGVIEGCAAVSVFFDDYDVVLLATNNGSLYLCRSRDNKLCVYASEQYILTQVLRDRELRDALGDHELVALRPGEGRLLDIRDVSIVPFTFDGGEPSAPPITPCGAPRAIEDLSDRLESEVRGHRTTAYSPTVRTGQDHPELLLEDKERISNLRRCTRCILPESFPFLDFDENGVCTLCRRHEGFDYAGLDKLREAVEPYRRRNGEPDCLVGVSGGRDSCHGLHVIKKVLGLNPIAYTYDWGMVTDLARRNTSRMCARLGIEHILVSANIAWKRSNIRKNVKAWLRKPDLGMVPLFMAGDKQFYYYANQLKQRTGIRLFMFCAGNRFETTDFKIGFCNIGSPSATGILTHLSTRKKLQLAAYYGRQYLTNPAYVNASVWDTLFAFFSSYLMPHDYIYLYHYQPWNEQEIMDTLVGDYGWERAADTAATWRIGDGTAAFYNYIYYTVAGFSEMDTFRSHQVREGHLTRDEALARATEENEPRYKSIKWYLNAIGMDIPFDDVIRRINAIPKLY